MDQLTRYTLILVLVVAAALRLFNLGDIPYTNDEISALSRLGFDGFGELIEKGVKVDGHPAGVQVFLWFWTALFGTLEWVVKLPFIVMGIASVWLMFLLGKRWGNNTVGLLGAAFLASMQYTVMFSQIARPYASGLFLSLLMLYFWSGLVRSTHIRPWYWFAYVLSAALCAYNHHFSLLFAAIVGLVGIPLVGRNQLWKYALAGLAIFALYIPHLPIFFHQLGIGGVHLWLGPPENNFIWRYLFYLLNYSWFGVALLGLVLVLGPWNGQWKKRVLFLVLFLLPLVIGFVYSRQVSPVLQFSVLIFSVPCLFLALFGHLREQSPLRQLLLVLLILVINTCTLVFGRKHYELFYNSQYEQIVLDMQTAKTESNTAAITASRNTKHTFYLEKHQVRTPHFQMADSITPPMLNAHLRSLDAERLYYGCVSGSPPWAPALLLEYYPALEWQHNYLGGTTFLYSQKGPDQRKSIAILSPMGNEGDWQNVPENASQDSSGSHYLIEGEWGPAYSTTLGNFLEGTNDFVDLRLEYTMESGPGEVLLVAELKNGEETLHWSASEGSDNAISAAGHYMLLHSLKLSDLPIGDLDTELKVYVWNKGLGQLKVSDLQVKLRGGNPVIYGLFEPI